MPDRVVVIGDPESVFVQTPVRFWRDRGVDALILTARWHGSAMVDGDLPVVTAESVAPAWLTAAAHGLHPFVEVINRHSLAQNPDRVATALRTWAHSAVPPSLAPPVFDALLIAAAADVLQPTCVFGHEAFAYGLATSLSAAPRKALMAWGADVLHYASMTDLSFAMVRQALHGVHYVLTNTATMEDALHERFAVPRQNIARISYGVDRRSFHRATGQRAAQVRTTFGIAPDAPVVMNVRRFLPHWGSAVAWPAMVAIAQQRPDVHLVLLGGSGSDAEMARAASDARALGLKHRVTMMRGHASLNTVAELMSVADVALSLVETLEPVSWSVQQAVACGAAVVVADQASYALEEERGLVVDRVPPASVTAAATAIAALIDDPGRVARMAAANQRYVAEHHDRDAQLTRLLRIVAGAAGAERLLGIGTSKCAPAVVHKPSRSPSFSD